MNSQDIPALGEVENPLGPMPLEPGEARHGITWQTEQGPLRCLLPKGLRAEIIRSPIISSIPSKNAWLIGIVNVRGELIPVIDLLIWAGLQESAEFKNSKQILLLGEGDSAVALMAEQQPELLMTSPATLKPNLVFQKLTAFTRSTHNASKQLWLDLDFKAWLQHLSQSKNENTGRQTI
jgi:twitching motility protein PilI